MTRAYDAVGLGRRHGLEDPLARVVMAREGIHVTQVTAVSIMAKEVAPRRSG
jgi:hypothetical protein